MCVQRTRLDDGSWKSAITQIKETYNVNFGVSSKATKKICVRAISRHIQIRT